MFGMWEMTKWVPDVPLSSFQLLVAGGALLICAAILLGMRRKMKVEMENSVVTEELMAYLARIANALESPRTPTGEEISAQLLRRIAEKEEGRLNGKVREMPFTLLDR
jgi:hypothetical protein